MTDSENLVVQSSDETINTWINRDFIIDSLKNKLRGVDVLITPRLNYGEEKTLTFPVGTHDLFTFLGSQAPSDLRVDICVDDDDYKELHLYADILILPDFIIYYVAAPIFAQLLANYLWDRWRSRNNKSHIETTITITDNIDTSVKLKYNGPATEFEQAVTETLRLISSQKDLQTLKDTTDLTYEERIHRLRDNHE